MSFLIILLNLIKSRVSGTLAIKVDIELKYFGLVHNLRILHIEIPGTLCGPLCPLWLKNIKEFIVDK